MRKRLNVPVGAVAVLGLALIAVPPIASGYWLKILTLAAVFALPALALGVLYGQLGFVSLAQVALVGVGGWTFLRIGHAAHLPNPVLLLCAGAVTCVIGTLVGLPSLRLTGLTLSLVTLMAAAAFEVVISAIGFPNGGSGFLGSHTANPVAIARPGFATSDAGLFRYCVIVVALLFAATSWIARGRVGRAWAMIRHSPAAAYASGIDVARYRLIGLSATSFLSGVGGGLLATGDGRLDPISFPALQSVVLFAVLLISGAFSFWGAAIGGLFYEGLPALLSQAGVDGNIIYVILGAGLINSLTTAPAGLVGQLIGLRNGIRRRVQRRRRRPQEPERTVPVALASTRVEASRSPR